MGVQFLTFVAIFLTLGSRWMPRSQALLRLQILNRPVVHYQYRGCTSLLERGVGGSCSMSSSPLKISRPGSIILGSKSFTRKMIVEEMGFAPIIRYSLQKLFHCCISSDKPSIWVSSLHLVFCNIPFITHWTFPARYYTTLQE